MQIHSDAAARQSLRSALILAGFTLALTLIAPAFAATPKLSDLSSTEPKPAEIYQTFYPVNVDVIDLQTVLRNMIPNAKLVYSHSQGAVSMRGTSEEIQLAQKILADMDRAAKVYRLSYTITELDNGKHTGVQHLSLVVAAGGKAALKQGNRVPIVTGTTDSKTSAESTQVQYVDVGLNIDVSLEGARLRTKVEQSGIADEKSTVGIQDPVIRQITLEGTSTVEPGKSVVLGILDIPGSTRRQEIEVVAELVH